MESSFSYEQLIACGNGELFGPKGPKLPLPNMLMIDEIATITDTGGAHGGGYIEAKLNIKKDAWFFACHFKDDPVMPGCLGLDALWQLIGFYLGWRGYEGKGRALGCNGIKFTGQVTSDAKEVKYVIDIKRVFERPTFTLGTASGRLYCDDELVYVADDLKVGLFNELDQPEK